MKMNGLNELAHFIEKQPAENSSVESLAERINRLHSEIIDHLAKSLGKAIQIGQLLTEQKKQLRHGEFGKWVKSNMPFTGRTARNYMRLYREREMMFFRSGEAALQFLVEYKSGAITAGNIEHNCSSFKTAHRQAMAKGQSSIQ